MRESNIIHEAGRFWVYREGPGHFTVNENRGSGSVVVGTFHFPNDPHKAMREAMTNCDARALHSS